MGTKFQLLSEYTKDLKNEQMFELHLIRKAKEEGKDQPLEPVFFQEFGWSKGLLTIVIGIG